MTTPAEHKANLAALRANSRLLASRAQVVGLNAGKCVRAIIQALASSLTPEPSSGDVDSVVQQIAVGMVPPIIRLGLQLPTYDTIVGALPTVILPGPPGPGGGNVDQLLGGVISYVGDGNTARGLFSGTPAHKIAGFTLMQITAGVCSGIWVGANIVAPIREFVTTTAVIVGHAGAFDFVGAQGQVVANPTGTDDAMNHAGDSYIGVAFEEPQ